MIICDKAIKSNKTGGKPAVTGSNRCRSSIFHLPSLIHQDVQPAEQCLQNHQKQIPDQKSKARIKKEKRISLMIYCQLFYPKKYSTYFQSSPSKIVKISVKASYAGINTKPIAQTCSQQIIYGIVSPTEQPVEQPICFNLSATCSLIIHQD